MVGLCAVIDAPISAIEDVTEYLRYFPSITIQTFDFERLTIQCAVHRSSDVVHFTPEQGHNVLIYGTIHTIRTDRGHCVADDQTIERLYAETGSRFVERLNGEFIVLVETPDGRVTVATDRLSKIPVYKTNINDKTVLSTSIPALIERLERPFTFSEPGLLEYFTFRRIYGIETAIQEIDQLSPATLWRENEGKINKTTYWQPIYEPKQWDTEKLVKVIADTVDTILQERLREDTSYGLLLSGGSDSRLLLPSMSEFNVTAFTLGDWWNREVEIAHRIATEIGVPFEFLRRTSKYHSDLLTLSARMNDFVSRFDQAHALGFADRLRQEVDVLINGMFADTFFKGHFLPVLSVQTPVGEFNPPIRKQFNSLEDYRTHLSNSSTPEFFRTDQTLEEVIGERITHQKGQIDHHGVKYSGLESAITSSGYYPLSNQKDVHLYRSLNNMLPTITPFLDDRLINLHLSIPKSIQLRGNLINRAVVRQSDELGQIPHSGTNVAPNRPFLLHETGYNLTRFRRNMTSAGGQPWFTNDPWPDQSELIRETELVLEELVKSNEKIESMPMIDMKAIHKMYDEHLDGKDHWEALYTLLTILNIPIPNYSE